MTTMTEPPQHTPSASVRLSIAITVLQGLLVLTWTLYAFFLPTLAVTAGLAKSQVIWLLVADQALFVLFDWLSSVYADRLARALRRLGPWLLAGAVLSSLLLAALPMIASWRSPTLLIVAGCLWAMTSSILRAPVFSLLGRVGGVSKKSGLVNGAVIGVGIAGAIGPVVTQALSQFDPRLPLALAAIVVIVATVPLLFLEPRPAVAEGPVEFDRKSMFAVACVIYLAALGMQFFTALALTQTPVAKAGALAWAVPLFWIGFAVGLVFASFLPKQTSRAIVTPVTLVAGGVLLYLATITTHGVVWSAVVAVAGACWAIAFSDGLTTALAQGRSAGLATPVGIFFSAISLAAVTRLVVVAIGYHASLPMSAAGWVWIVTAAFAVAGASWVLRPRGVGPAV